VPFSAGIDADGSSASASKVVLPGIFHVGTMNNRQAAGKDPLRDEDYLRAPVLGSFSIHC
jgi:hypothetical protein